ncbi:MAG: hypothetical protein ACRCWI_07045 [Brevinema sp.]
MRTILLLGIIFTTGLVHTLVNQYFVVIDHNVPAYQSFVDKKVVDYIDLGVPITVSSRKGARVQFRYRDRDLWVDQKYIAALNFNQRNFSDSATLFAELPVVNEEGFSFVYRNQLYCVDLNKLPDLKVKSRITFPNFSQVSASSNRSIFLLTGDVLSNNVSLLNLAFYENSTKKFSPLTYFRGDKVTINSSDFSQDGRYVSILFVIDNINIVHVYDVKEKKLILAEKGVLDITWYNSILFLFTEKNIIYYSGANLANNNILYRFNKVIETAPTTSIIGGLYFLQLDNSVYCFDDGKLQKTNFRSLERSPKGYLEQYTQGEQICTFYKNRRIRSLSGKTPVWTLLSILDDERLLYRQQKDALQILSIYNAETEKNDPYYWMEEPFYTFKNGISFEYLTEDQEIWLFIEKSGGFAKAVRIQDIIN